jgi:hypothetical protein
LTQAEVSPRESNRQCRSECYARLNLDQPLRGCGRHHQPMTEKHRILEALGEAELVVPALVNRGLTANGPVEVLPEPAAGRGGKRCTRTGRAPRPEERAGRRGRGRRVARPVRRRRAASNESVIYAGEAQVRTERPLAWLAEVALWRAKSGPP